MAGFIGNTIRSLFYLALIAAVIVGAKLFWYDPLQEKNALKKLKDDIDLLVQQGQWEEAQNKIAKFEERYPNQKKFCNNKRFEIYVQRAEKAYNAMLEYESQRSKAKNNPQEVERLGNLMKTKAEECLSALDTAEKFGEITRIEQQWRVNALGVLGRKEEARAAMQRQAQMPK